MSYDDHALGGLIGDQPQSVVFENSKTKRFTRDFNCEAGWGEWIETLLNFQKMVKESCQLWDKIIVGNEKAIP